MARIAGVNLPLKKRMEIALTYIYGIGRPSSRKILKQASIGLNVRVSELTSKQESDLREVIEKKYAVEGELRRRTFLNIKNLKEIGSYRGSRHAKNMPARGQRTKTNCRTVRGNVRDRTAGSGKRPSAQKT